MCFEAFYEFMNEMTDESKDILTYWRAKFNKHLNIVILNSIAHPVSGNSYPVIGGKQQTHISYQNKTYKVFLTKSNNKKYINQNRKRVFLETIRNKYRYAK
jgi:hypothetical protein